LNRPRPQHKDWQAFLTLAPYLWEHRARVITALGLLLLAKIASVLLPVAMKQVVDALDASRHAVLVLPLLAILAYGSVRVASLLFGELRDAIFAKVTQGAIRRIALRVFRHLHELSLRFHLDRQTGGVSRDIERGTNGINTLLHFMVFNILPTIVELTLITGILFFYYGAWYALILFITAAVYVIYTLLITEWRMKFRRRMNEMDSRANSRAIDSLINYETVKYFGNEDFEARRYDATLREWETAAIKSQTSLAVLNIGQGAIVSAGMTGVLLLAGRGVVQGEMTLGDLVLVSSYMMQMFIPMNFLGYVYREIKHALADMEKMFRLLGEHREVADRPDARPLCATPTRRSEEAGGQMASAARITFEHVDFGYSPRRPILHNISFEIPPGRKVAVVGPSGAGKSTLVRLLFRFYDVTSGAIRIDGVDIRDVTQESLRKAIAIVPQDTVLFNDTIRYNIAYARPDARPEEVARAAEMAHLKTFIEGLPEGYETLVGERGLKLSGGEKQRIAIARAILKRPRIMIFDEATSALDSEAERAILQALGEISVNHTTLVIAHRLSTIVDADQIVVMVDGRIAERGDHAELLRADGVYARMWTLQQQQRQDRDERLRGLA
jgi:ABC-type transport system involved in Fe-S cluster assembly fused permease/ATPase subunit